MTYEEKLLDLAHLNSNIVVMTAENRAAIRNLPKTLGERFIDVGIAEQTLVGAAAGLALRGRIPVAHALATFLTMRAFEFIRTDIGIANLPVKLVGFVPGFLSEANGPTHQAVEDISLMRGIPNMKIFSPADIDELVEGLPHVIADASPWYIRYNAVPPVVKHYNGFTVGTAEVLSDGMDVALITYGFMTREVWRAKEILEIKGYSVRYINLRTVKPVDEYEILSAAKECSLIVTVEDHLKSGGLYSIVGEIFLKHAVMAPVLPIALNSCWFKPAPLYEILSYEGFSGEQIASKILVALNDSDGSGVSEETDSAVTPYISNFDRGE